MGNYFSVNNHDDTTNNPHDDIKDFEDLSNFKYNHLIVLDLSGTLIEKLYPKQARKIPQKPDVIIRNIHHIYKRQHLRKFLEYVFDNFTVCVWSNMLPKNTNPIVDLIFTPEQKKLLRVFNHKDLAKIYDDNWTPLNTIAIDDVLDSKNIITISRFRVSNNPDNALRNLKLYLEELQKAEKRCKHIFDVRTYLKYHKL